MPSQLERQPCCHWSLSGKFDRREQGGFEVSHTARRTTVADACFRKQLSTAYNVTQRSNNHILRCLIFAFTTSLHLYGSVERILLQLETGRDLAGLMGGKDRSDGVGQLALGLWFAQKLKGIFGFLKTCGDELTTMVEYHRREGNVEKHGEAKKLQQRHSTHLERLRNGKHAG